MKLVAKKSVTTDTINQQQPLMVFYTMDNYLIEKTRSVIDGQTIPKEIETILIPNEKGDISFLQISCLDTIGDYEPLSEGTVYIHDLLKDGLLSNTKTVALSKTIFTDIGFDKARLIRYYFRVLSTIAK